MLCGPSIFCFYLTTVSSSGMSFGQWAIKIEEGAREADSDSGSWQASSSSSHSSAKTQAKPKVKSKALHVETIKSDLPVLGCEDPNSDAVDTGEDEETRSLQALIQSAARRYTQAEAITSIRLLP